MKVVMVAVVSEDGYITRGSDPNPWQWTSLEDKKLYVNQLHRNDLYLMGSNTYSIVRNNIPLNAHKIVMSHNPNEQPNTPGITFTNKSFKDIIAQYSSHQEMLVLGGVSVFHQLLDQRLIDEAFITIEPIRHGRGVQLYTHKNYFEDMGFYLSERKQLNDEGTILKHYVLKK